LKAAEAAPDNYENISTVLGILIHYLHIIESILSQEELPDFYEQNLDSIAGIMQFVLEADF